jgi:hypothetical protein
MSNHSRRRPVFSAVLLSLLMTSTSSLAQGRTKSSISGVIRLSGCTASADQLALRAVPLTPYDPLTESQPRPLSAVRMATIAPTSSPQEFTFHIANVIPNVGHRLGIQFSTDDCAKVFWRGPAMGVVAAGTSDVAFEGIAIRTQVEVLGEVSRDRRRAIWVGADNLRFDDPVAAIRRLRVRSNLPEITDAVIQIATAPFPTGDDAERFCEGDGSPGLIRTMELELSASDWTEIDVDFHDIILGRRVAPTLEELLAGAPIYVRAIPAKRILDVKQRICNTKENGAPGTVVLSKLPILPPGATPPEWPARIQSIAYKGPIFYKHLNGSDLPRQNETCYRVVSDHQLFPLSHWDITIIGATKWGTFDTLLKGQRFCIPHDTSGSGWFEDFTDSFTKFVTGAVDFVGALVNDISALYENIKEKVAEVIVEVLKAVGVPCGDEPPEAPSCQQLVSTGINIALAAAGMPPSLPNFSELKTMGREYVAAQIASQTGIPPELAAKSLEYAERSLNELDKKTGGGKGLPEWLTVDLGLDPAFLRVTVEANAELPKSALVTNKNFHYLSSLTSVPTRLGPGYGHHSLTIPIVLKPNYGNFNKMATDGEYDTALFLKSMWQLKLSDPHAKCTTFEFQPIGLLNAAPFLFPYVMQGTLTIPALFELFPSFVGPPPFTAIHSECAGPQ